MQQQTVRPTTLRSATDYRPALLWLMGELGQAQTSEAVAEFERRLGDLIPPEHRELNESGSIKWENYVRWARQALADVGLMGSGGWGVWTVTEAGQKWLQDHPDGGKDELLALSYRSRATRKELTRPSPGTEPQSIEVDDKVFTLSQAEVLAAVREAVAGGVPPEARRFKNWHLAVDGERLSVKWVMSLVTGLPYSRFKTGEARRQLSRLGLEAQPVDKERTQISLADDTPAQVPELTGKEFFQAVLMRLAGRLPPEVYWRDIEPRGGILQLKCPAPSSHYEIMLRRRYAEVGLHFEGRRESNLALLDQFRPHLQELQNQLGEPICAEPWGKNWARVSLQRPSPRLDMPTARTLADLLLHLIEVTLPLLREAVADSGLRMERGRPPDKVKENDLGRPKAILAETIRDICAYLKGDGALSPSDEKLCDWVQFCYTFERFAEGAALFKLVRHDAVPSWLYERTRKLARACEVRLKQ